MKMNRKESVQALLNGEEHRKGEQRLVVIIERAKVSNEIGTAKYELFIQGKRAGIFKHTVNIKDAHRDPEESFDWVSLSLGKVDCQSLVLQIPKGTLFSKAKKIMVSWLQQGKIPFRP